MRYDLSTKDNSSSPIIGTWVRKNDNASTTGKIDVLLRISNQDFMAGYSYKIQAQWTSNVLRSIKSIIFANDVLKHALRNQWRNHKYTEEYIQMLLGQYTKEEFVPIAKKYALPFNKYSVEDLENTCFVIHDALQENVQTEELAQLLNVDPLDIDRVFISYMDSRFDSDKSGGQNG